MQSQNDNNKHVQKSNTGLLIAGIGLVLAGVLALAVKKRFSKALEKAKEEVRVEDFVKLLNKNADEKGVLSWQDALNYTKSFKEKIPNLKETFVWRFTEADKAKYQIQSKAKEIVLMGYIQSDKTPKILKIFTCDKLDDELIKKFGNENMLLLT